MSVGRNRNPSVDVLRVGLMLLIVMHHCWRHGVYYHENSWMDLLFTMSIIWHVDSFVAISGWFGIRFSLQKFFKLYGVIFFYSILSFIYLSLSEHSFSLSRFEVTSGWFGGAYLMLMFCAPLLNEAIECASRKGWRYSMSLWAPFAIGYILGWAPRGAFSGVGKTNPISLFSVIFVYVTMRLFKLSLSNCQLKRVARVGLTAFPCVFFAFSIIAIFTSHGSAVFRYAGYNSPQVWLFAVSLVILFATHLQFPNWLGCFCVTVSPMIFGIYIMHECTSFGRELYRIPEQYLANLPSCLVVPTLAIVVFAFCLAVEWFRHGMVGLVFARLGRVPMFRNIVDDVTPAGK